MFKHSKAMLGQMLSASAIWCNMIPHQLSKGALLSFLTIGILTTAIPLDDSHAPTLQALEEINAVKAGPSGDDTDYPDLGSRVGDKTLVA